MPGKYILVVDDEPSVGQSIKITLQPDGHRLEVVTSPFEALRRIERNRSDIILTDFRMQGMTGLQLAEQIKARDPAQPIILISGSPPFPPTSLVDRIILKPFSTMELREAVAQLAR
jgi:CheY-like chemotaxis protein